MYLNYVIAFAIGAIISALVCIIFAQRSKIKSLIKETKIDNQEKIKRFDWQLLKWRILGRTMKILRWIGEIFIPEGRYRRRVFWPRYAVLVGLVSSTNTNLMQAFADKVLRNELNLHEYNFCIGCLVMIAGIILGPCVSKRYHDVGLSSIWWAIGILLFMPYFMAIDWDSSPVLSTMETIMKMGLVCFAILHLYATLSDSEENNKWGESPKYPNGKGMLH
jgi:uncharacterized membrane protein YhaH (DUF805 family)